MESIGKYVLNSSETVACFFQIGNLNRPQSNTQRGRCQELKREIIRQSQAYQKPVRCQGGHIGHVNEGRQNTMIKKRNDLSSNHGFLMVMGVPFPWFSIPKRNDGKTLDIVIRIFRHSSSNPGPKTWSVERIQGGGLKNDARCTRCLSKIWMIYWLVVWNNHPN